MWNDNDTRIDFVDFQHLVQSVKNLIENDNLLPCSIGLYGDWGSGKSSLMRMIEAEFENKENVLTVKFNGWLFEGYEDAKTVLMGTILDELIKNRVLTKQGIKLASKLLKKIDWLKVASGSLKSGLGFLSMGPLGLALGTPDAAQALEKLSDINYEEYVEKIKDSGINNSLRMGIRDFHNDFSKFLEETKIEKLVIFIDDLDRCNPNTVIDTLEAIKLFLFVEKTAFVIGADERLIKYAVKKRFPEIPSERRFDVGRDYLEKLIQFPVRIPQLSHSEMETYMNLLFTTLYVKDAEIFEKIRTNALLQKETTLFDTSFSLSNLSEILGSDEKRIKEKNIKILKEALALSARITPILTKNLHGNPRQSKRFLNTLLLRIIMAESKKIHLEKRVLAKLMTLEYFKPETFRKLSEWQIKQEGKPKEIKEIEAYLDKTVTEEKKELQSDQLKGWLSDEDVKEWFENEPYLSEIDLRPYFYFSRDKLDSVSAFIQRMSAGTQEIFIQLISSQTTRKQGIKKLKNISPADGAALFEAIKEKSLEKNETSYGESFLAIMIDIVSQRAELASQLFIFLGDLPESYIKSSIIPRLIAATKDTNAKSQLIVLLSKWSNSAINSLSKIATSRLETLNNS